MKTIKFLEDYVVQDDVGTEYKKGQVEMFVDASANHFTSRGLAVEVSAEKPKSKLGRPTKSDDKASVGGKDSGMSGNRTKSSKG